MNLLNMIEYNQKEGQLAIKIPISGINELYSYQKSILAVLGRIEIHDCNRAFVENLKAVYKLLGHLALDAEFLSEYGDLIPEQKNAGKKQGRGETGGGGKTVEG